MKIVHICLAGSYNDNWGYQDNLIPKYHIKDGHDVTVITSVFKDRTDSTGYRKVGSGHYYLDNGIKIIRIPFKSFPLTKIIEKLRVYEGLYSNLIQEAPDFIFIHGVQFLDMRTVVKYLKSRKHINVVVDNHSDFSNSAKNWFSKNILHKVIWRYCANIIDPYCNKFYGVLPARVDFLINVYKVPVGKTELLVMGADDEQVKISKKKDKIQALREKYEINQDDFLIVTGGKIDEAKKQTLLLMRAVKEIDNPKVILIVFGSVVDTLKDDFEALVDNVKVKYAGWISADESYQYFAASDLVVFPGRHSVFWEQVAGIGIPMMIKKWDGTGHVDVGGNCIFLNKDSKEEIKSNIEFLLQNPEKYMKMKNVAENKGMMNFSYKKIARKSLQVGK
jgi:1,2-diacylglycerol 3-alpha-glucosyltransferase